jgi:hypothetical protein
VRKLSSEQEQTLNTQLRKVSRAGTQHSTSNAQRPKQMERWPEVGSQKSKIRHVRPYTDSPWRGESEIEISLQDRDARKNFVELRHLFLVVFFRDPIGHRQDFVAGLGHHEADRCRTELFVIPVP